MTYLIKHRRDRHVTATKEATVHWARKTRRTGERVGPIAIAADAGIDRTQLLIGKKGHGYYTGVPATAAGIKTVLRRMRPQEADQLAAFDAEISRLRKERENLIQASWSKAHVVTLQDARPPSPTGYRHLGNESDD